MSYYWKPKDVDLKVRLSGKGYPEDGIYFSILKVLNDSSYPLAMYRIQSSLYETEGIIAEEVQRCVYSLLDSGLISKEMKSYVKRFEKKFMYVYRLV